MVSPRTPGIGARLAFVCLVLLGGVPGQAAALEATLERNPIHANETVRLVLTSEGRGGTERPDLRPLGRDFEVLGVSTNTQVRFENGRQSATTVWVAELAPKRTGTLAVPALTLAGERSRPQTLEVLPARSDGAPGAGELFLESEVTPERPYVQAQVRYVVRLFRALDLLEGASLTEPAAEGAVVTRLGTDLAYTAERGGRRYRVLERRYALFAQASGTLAIAPVEFTGEVVEPGQGGAFGGLFAQGRRVRLTTDAVELEVRPRPDSAAGPASGVSSGAVWLPAADLVLEEDWPATAAPAVGEPITRTVRIRADGLRGDQLPALDLSAPAGVRVYADQPVTTTGSTQDWVRGTREQRVALIPEQAGTITLPEIRVAWWDVERDAPAWATVPARTIEVAPAPSQAVTPAPATAPGAASAGAATRGAPGSGSADEHALPGAWSSPSPWQWLSAALALAWLTTMLAWARSRSGTMPRDPLEAPGASRTGTERDARAALAALDAACAGHDAGAARDALRSWADIRLTEDAPTSLGALARSVADTELREALRELDRALYAGDPAAWSGATLGPLVGRLTALAPGPSEPSPGALPALYPQRR